MLSFPIGDSGSGSFNLNSAFAVPLLADMLSDLLVPYTPSSDQVYRVAQYAPRYRLAFTLLNEDASEGGSALSWDIAGAISGSFIFAGTPLNASRAQTYTSRAHVSDLEGPFHPA
jgi:hypothetical protein